MISVDYQDKLYRIKVEQPLGPDKDQPKAENEGEGDVK